MKKRGIVTALSGVALVVVALVMATAVVSSSSVSVDGNVSVAKLFEGMFDSVTDETVISPGSSAYFTFTTTKPDVPLFWGLQVTDFQDGDQYTVKISNIYGDSFGAFSESSPTFFQVVKVPAADTYNFQVNNDGKRQMSVVMMFTEDPDNSSAFNNPDSPVSKIILPVLVSGILLILGIMLLAAGTIITAYDWKSGKKSFV